MTEEISPDLLEELLSRDPLELTEDEADENTRLLIQGLQKPYNDLSRGCNVEDIINVACICAILA